MERRKQMDEIQMPVPDLLDALIGLAFDWDLDCGVEQIWVVRVKAWHDVLLSGIAAIRPTRELALFRAREILAHPRWNEGIGEIVERERGETTELRCGTLKIKVEPTTMANLLRSMGISHRALDHASFGARLG